MTDWTQMKVENKALEFLWSPPPPPPQKKKKKKRGAGILNILYHGKTLGNWECELK